MRNNFKKFAALALVLVMLVSTFVPAFAAENSCPGADKTHTATNCTYTVVGTKEATCTEPGYVTGRCSTCNKQFTVETIAATGHTWSEEKGNCTTGVTKTCEICGLKEAVTAADGHNWSAWIINADECDIGVQAQRVCTGCQVKQSKVMTEKHNWELVEYTAPESCTVSGSASYKCGTKDCTATKTEKVLLTTNGQANSDGHSWAYVPYTALSAWTGNAADTGVNQKVAKDIVLSTGVVITKEIWNGYVDRYVAHTCLGGSVEPMVCTKCGAYQEDGIAPIPANQEGIAGHPNPAAHHQFTQLVAAKAPTCTEAGSVEYLACSRGCGTYLYNTTQYLAEPTYDTATSTWAAAVVAEKTGDQYMAITHKLSDLAMAPQHWNYTDPTYSTPATCAAAGKRAYHCVLCGDANVKTYEVTAPTGHVFYTDLSVEKQAELMQKATQEAAILYLTGTTPSVAAFVNYIEAAIERTIVQPTCVAAGSITYTCLACSDASAKKVEAGAAATGHVEDPVPGNGSVNPTCSSNGVYVYWCKNGCGTTLRSEAVEALGHVMTDVVKVKEATCQEEGKIIAVCARGCEYGAKDTATPGYVEFNGKYVHVDLSENLVTIPKTHNWEKRDASGNKAGEIVISCADTDVADRTYDRVCATCGAYELGVVYDAVDHVHFDFNTSYALGLASQAIVGTCTTQGVWYLSCASCGGAPVKYVDPYTGNGHDNLVLFEGKAATCKSEPQKAWTEASVCLECGHVETLKFLSNHHINPTTGTQWAFTDILMNKAGIDLYFYDAHQRKLTTKYTTVASVPEAQREMIVALKRGAKLVDGMPANADDYVKEVALSENVVWTFYVPADCTTLGYFGGQLCTLCNNADCVNGVSTFSPASGGQNKQFCTTAGCTTPSHTSEGMHVRVKVGGEAMTCEQYGYERYECIYCKETIQVGYTAPKHNFQPSEDDTKLEQTCDLDGYYTQYCAACGTTESVVIKADGHKNAAGKTIVNSCIDRTGDRYCVVCASVIPMDHNFGEWTEADGVKTRTCADCAYVESVEIETEPVETEPVETEPEVTEPEETKPVETTPVETKPVETTPVETEPADEKGCGGSIAAVAVALVAALGTCVVFAGKKRD